ncbi:MAG TPA: hypothetical protein VF297_06365 [Pyrinomonadaceae bacterium]
MSKALSRRLSRKFFTLSLLLVCLVCLTAGPDASADEDCCISKYNTCNAQCPPICDANGCYSNIPCERTCDKQYFECTAWGGVSCKQEPEEPCPGCQESCDVMQQECVASGGDPRSCVFAGYRCRQSCYVGCPQ